MDITATITYMSIRFVLLGRLRRSNARYWSIILRKVIPFSDAVFFALSQMYMVNFIYVIGRSTLNIIV